MEQLLKPVETTDSVFIYRDDQKFTCTDYDKLSEYLAESLFETDQNERFMTDLRYSHSHPLMFEFSAVNHTEKNTYDFWNRFVDFMFIRALRKYIVLPEITILLAMSKSQTKGLRVYVVGVEISHDDYLHLCSLLKNDCLYGEADLDAILEVRSDFPLPSSDRPDGTGDLYVPARLINIKFNFYEENDIWYPYRQEVIEFDETDHASLVRDMMPIPRENATHVHFAMDIYHDSHFGNARLGNDYVANFKSHFNHESYTILRNNNLLVKGKGFCYNFIKRYANNIELMNRKHNGKILDFWYNLFLQRSPLNEAFFHLDQILKRQCPHLSNEPSPLKATLLKYERPVYYALVNMLGKEIDVGEIRKQFPFISKNLPSVPPKEAEHLHFKTILYCAYMTGEGTIFDHLGVAFYYIAKNINSLHQLKKHVLLIQETVFPVISNPKTRYIWDPIANEWNAAKDNKNFTEFKNVIQDIVWIINAFYNLPIELTDRLLNESAELQEMLLHIAFNGESVRDYTLANAITEKVEVYGHNVPEYYFLDETFTRVTAEPPKNADKLNVLVTEPSTTETKENVPAIETFTTETKENVPVIETFTTETKENVPVIESSTTETKENAEDKLIAPVIESSTMEENVDKPTVSATESSTTEAKENSDENKLTAPMEEDDKSTFRIRKEPPLRHSSHHRITEEPPLRHSSHHRITEEPPLRHSSHHRNTEEAPLIHSRHHRTAEEPPSSNDRITEEPPLRHSSLHRVKRFSHHRNYLY